MNDVALRGSASPPERRLAAIGVTRFTPMSKTPELPQTFESALLELEAIVAAMEGAQLPLKESLAAYKRGAELVAYCQTTLRNAQQEVAVLEQGVLKAFTAESDGDAP